MTQRLNHPVIRSLNSGRTVAHFLEDKGIEDGEDVLAVGDNSLDVGMVPGVANGEAFPTLQDLRGNVNVPPELFDWVTAQKKPVEKRRLIAGLGQARFDRCECWVSVHGPC